MTETTILATPNTRRAFFVLAAALILVAAFVVDQFSTNAAWEAFDYAMLGGLLLGAWLVFEVATALIRNSTHRLAIGAVVGVMLLLVWVELALGLVGTPAAGS